MLKGAKDCEIQSGDIISASEQFLEKTENAIECSRQVRMLRPLSVGMTWKPTSQDCYAKFGLSEAITDINGCLSCKTCSFGTVVFHH